MGHARQGDDRRRGASGRGDATRSQRDRLRIAQTAARLIAEHGLTDWALAKRKAARQLMLPEATTMPSNDDIEQALLDHHALFGADEHAATLHAQRTEALRWMRRLAAFGPLLVGGVAAGWATEHSDIRIELLADDPKAVEMALAGAGVAYVALPPRETTALAARGTELLIDGQRAGIRLSVLSPQQRRNRPRGDDEPRLDADALAALVGPPPHEEVL
jgi:hypothetical protein